MSNLHKYSVSNHALESTALTYANLAARVADTTAVSADLGRIAYQTDTGEYWRLIATGGGAAAWQRIDPNAMRYLGAWSGATAYLVNDVVVEGGIVYICIDAHTNHVPPNGTYWAPVGGSPTGSPYWDEFTGDGATTAYTLSKTPIGKVAPFVNGVRQSSGQWSITGSTVTFGFTPAPADVIVIDYSA